MSDKRVPNAEAVRRAEHGKASAIKSREALSVRFGKALKVIEWLAGTPSADPCPACGGKIAGDGEEEHAESCPLASQDTDALRLWLDDYLDIGPLSDCAAQAATAKGRAHGR